MGLPMAIGFELLGELLVFKLHVRHVLSLVRPQNPADQCANNKEERRDVQAGQIWILNKVLYRIHRVGTPLCWEVRIANSQTQVSLASD